MSAFELSAANLLSPAILCFVLGAITALLRSDFKLPESLFTGLSVYLMLSIGLRGGAELSEHPFSAMIAPIGAAILIGCLTPLWCYAILRRVMGLSVANAAAIAAHYGSVSAVTFAAVTNLLTKQGVPYEGYAAALLAIMEVPAIIVALGLAGIASMASRTVEINVGGTAILGGPPTQSERADLTTVLMDVLSSKSVLLLVGGVAIGAVVGPHGLKNVKPLFADLFPGVLCLFLLDLGRVAASHAGEFRKVGAKLAAFAVVMPVLHAAFAIPLAHWAGLSQGGAIVLATLAASASYIAAPAAVRLALPDANPGLYLPCSLAITFPFNLLVGIPLYAAMSAWMYGPVV